MLDNLFGPRGDWVEGFTADVWSSGPGLTLPHRLASPEVSDPQARFPLVLFLHGAGERGTDNRAQLRHGVWRFVDPEARARHPAFVLAPQCPRGTRQEPGYWLGVHPEVKEKERDDPRADVLGMLAGLTRFVMRRHPVDPARVYLAGISMGAFATWALLTKEAGMFAAAVPVCGGGDPAWAARIGDVPIWVFHGSDDRVVPVEYSRRLIEALRARGASPRYTEYPGVGHDSWTAAFQDPELLDWLFAQRRR